MEDWGGLDDQLSVDNKPLKRVLSAPRLCVCVCVCVCVISMDRRGSNGRNVDGTRAQK